jgi:small-conductance mechanosensitive channel
MMSSMVVNRTIKDPRRWVTVTLPLRPSGSVENARELVTRAAQASPLLGEFDLVVRLDDVRQGAAWLTVTAFAPPGADVPALAAELRERALAALVGADLLAA